MFTYSYGDVMKKGFTLAEVLITLGIIGIVAALTIPTLIQNYQKKETATRLTQTYSILSQAVRMAQVEYGDISTWGYQNDKDTSHNFADTYKMASVIAEKYFLPYIKIAKNYGTTTPEKAGFVSDYNTKDGRVYKVTVQYLVELINGVVLMFYYNGNINSDGTAFKLSNPTIFVDLNGKSGPNTQGIDFFAFVLDSSQNKLVAFGDGYSRDALKNYCKKDSSLALYDNLRCTELIKIDNWKIADDYPW